MKTLTVERKEKMQAGKKQWNETLEKLRKENPELSSKDLHEMISEENSWNDFIYRMTEKNALITEN